MWAIKILNGPQQGKIFPLQSGNNVLGRSLKANIRIDDQGVSKSHAQIFVTNDKVIVSDLQSSNGTFVNGIQVQNHGLKTGDKVLVNRTIFTIFQLPDNVVFPDKATLQLQGGVTENELAPQTAVAIAKVQDKPSTAMTEFSSEPNALSTEFANFDDSSDNGEEPITSAVPAKGIARIAKQAEDYIDKVALPPVYKATEKVEFKYVTFIFAMAFIFIVTFLSAIPLSHVVRESVIKESRLRAQTLAQNLAQMNRKALSDNSELSLTTDFASRQAGVEKALIVSAHNGSILSPSNLIGKFIKDPFVISLKNTDTKKTDVLENTHVGASVPIKIYDADIGDARVVAYAVIVYKLDSTALSLERKLSLLIQIFMIAAFFASLIFLVQYKVIIHPLQLLNKGIDLSLREGTSDIQVPFQLKVFQDLVSNINSALSRVTGDGTDEGITAHIDKDVEASALVNMFPFASFALDPETSRITALNEHLADHPLFDSDVAVDMSIEELTDQSLYQSLKDLHDTAMMSPNSKHSNILPQDVTNYEISVKIIVDNNKPSYLIFTVIEMMDDEEDAA